MARSAALSAILVALAAAPAAAQAPLAPAGVPAAAQAPLVSQRLDSGTVVRLRLRDDVFETGRLLAPFGRDSAALLLCRWPGRACPAGDDRRVRRPSTEVLGLQVHRGSAWGTFAVIGAILGVPMGLQLAQLRYLPDEGTGTERVTPRQKIRTALEVSAVTALFGAMIGEFFPQWGPAPSNP